MVAAGNIAEPCRVMAVGYRLWGPDELPIQRLGQRRRVVTLSEDRRQAVAPHPEPSIVRYMSI